MQKDEEKKVNAIRDIQGGAADQELIKLLIQPAPPISSASLPFELKYDEQYINKIVESYQNKILDISSVIDTFLAYTNAFKKYTEDKVYSGAKNVQGFIQQVLDFEGSMQMEVDRDDDTYLLHACFSNVWRLVNHLEVNIDRTKYSFEDKLAFSENFQRVLA